MMKKIQRKGQTRADSGGTRKVFNHRSKCTYNSACYNGKMYSVSVKEFSVRK